MFLQRSSDAEAPDPKRRGRTGHGFAWGGRSDQTTSLQIVAKFCVRPEPGSRELVTYVRRRKRTYTEGIVLQGTLIREADFTLRAIPRVRLFESRVAAVTSSTLPALTNPRNSEWANSALADDPRLLLSCWVAVSTRIEEGSVPQWRNCLSNAKADLPRQWRVGPLGRALRENAMQDLHFAGILAPQFDGEPGIYTREIALGAPPSAGAEQSTRSSPP
ncbi:hypothetical protein R1flu_028814 [Riccia fluitans]|uniref:Uncharacterized protein n=1 Tax=Riccia fluitans TaxID=41844 RepID=A0ABD1XQR3_9MARC